MVHLWNRGTKNEPEDKELIWVARWMGGGFTSDLQTSRLQLSDQQTNKTVWRQAVKDVCSQKAQRSNDTHRRWRKHSGGKIRDKLWQESSFEADSPGCGDALEASKSRKSTFLHEDKWGVNYWLFFCRSSTVESCSLPIFWINVFKICLFEAPCWLKTDVVTDAHTSAHN